MIVCFQGEIFMKKLIYFLVLFNIFLLLSHCNSQENEVHKAFLGIPELSPNELWINSIPAGLNVFLFKESPSVYGVPLETRLSWVENNYLGRTPITTSLTEREFVIGLTISDSLEKELFGGTRRKLCHFGPFTGLGWIKVDAIPNLENEGKMWKYYVERKKDKSVILFILFQRWDVPLDSLESNYPKKVYFKFKDDQLKSDLVKQIPNEEFLKLDIEKAIDLLHRGGKVFLTPYLLDTKPYGWIIEIIGNNKWVMEKINP